MATACKSPFSSLLFVGFSFYALLVTTATYAQQQSIPVNYSIFPFQLPSDIENIFLIDADSDGLQDLVTLSENRISVYFQTTSQAFNFSQSNTSMEIPGDAVGWDLSFNYSSVSENGKPVLSVIALIEGRNVTSWPLVNRQFAEPQIIHSNLGGFLTRGVHRLHFSRDINDDGLEDLVIPAAGSLLLYIRNTDGSYQSAFPVPVQMSIRTTLNAEEIVERRVGQSVSIPLMRLRDVNSDGAPDLISRTEEKLEVFLANSNTASNDAIQNNGVPTIGNSESYFSQTPSYTLDLTELQERTRNFELSDIDLSNLTGVLAITHQEILEDINQDGIEDLLVREGGKISIFAGTEHGMDLSRPKQILRSGGNVLSTFLYDEDGDGLNDLWLWRIEDVSIGDVFLWLAISSSIKIDAFIYTNNGEQFARRPSRQITVTLKFPSVIRLISTALGIEEELDNLENETIIPTTIANLDNIRSSRELVALINNHIEIFLNAIENNSNEIFLSSTGDNSNEIDEDEMREEFLSYLDYSRSKDNYELDIRKLINNISFTGNKELENVSGVEPDYRFALDEIVTGGALVSTDLNNDALDDVFIFIERNSSHIRGLLLLSKKM